ncbi:MAG: N-acetyl-alpha-D-glucosaminyl L-malate synthase BshA [Planctomycetes bacterium]|nr:N-acetyl-alpha-D-glucosaminyl L-malate synthase BshA [Planctomycetota bacterium]
MRIGLLAHPTHGGSGVVACELAASLARGGDEVHLASHDVPPRLADDAQGVHLHVVRGAPYPLFERAPHELALASRLLEEHRRAPFDLLHAHYALPHAVVAWIVREAAGGAHAPRIVTTLHGTDTNLVGAAPEYAPLLAHVLAASDAVTCVSEHLAREARDAFGLTGERAARVIPDFVDTARFRPRPRPTGAPARVVHVSNFRPLKRVPWLVEAFAAAAAGGDAELVLVGEGPELDASRAAAERSGARVTFLGPRRDLAEVVADADVFALASAQESFGLAALEAMAAGVPVLAPAVGGLPEVLRDGVEGRLVPPDDRAAWSAALRELLGDPALRARLGAAGRARAVARFGREEIVARYRALYVEVLRAAPRR